jgi:hypothetical protein
MVSPREVHCLCQSWPISIWNILNNRLVQWKPIRWYRYIKDTILLWFHAKEEFRRYQRHLNSIHSNISLSAETEEDNTLPFLYALGKWKHYGSLGHTVYRKPTHTDLYLYASSHHHPSQEHTILLTLIQQAKTTCEPE